MPGRPVISEQTVLDAVRGGQTVLGIPANALITPLARDTARKHGVRFEKLLPGTEAVRPSAPERSVAIGSDHGGFEYKTELSKHLRRAGWTVVDVGTDSTASCDYPDFAYAVARSVASGRTALGLMIDGAGIGSAIACNKVAGVRAACAYNEFTAWNARAHNDANVLTLGSRTLGIEVCRRILDVFCQTAFEGGRHATRVQKIEDIETHGRS